jgi:hypothetical protein
LRIGSRDLNSAKISEERWQRELDLDFRGWQLADDGRVERVQLTVESPAVKRRLYMCRCIPIF